MQSFEHLPSGTFYRTLSNFDGRFPYILGSEIEEEDKKLPLVEIKEGSLFTSVAETAEFFRMPIPKLYWRNKNRIGGEFTPISASIVIEGPMNVLDASYASSISQHEFGHGFQGWYYDALSVSLSMADRLGHRKELESDAFSAAFTSPQGMVELLDVLKAQEADNVLKEKPEANRVKVEEALLDKSMGTHPTFRTRYASLDRVTSHTSWGDFLQDRNQKNLNVCLCGVTTDF